VTLSGFDERVKRYPTQSRKAVSQRRGWRKNSIFKIQISRKMIWSCGEMIFSSYLEFEV
jgi:hypothetical protein